jgi:hypothetical protein
MALRFAPARGASVVISSSSRGPTGATGTAATATAGTTTTGVEGTSAAVANSGTTAAAVFDFTIPRGTVPAIGFNFDTSTTDADPGAGDVRFNNAAPASVTEIYFDNADRDGTAITAWLDSFDDSTATIKGTLTFTATATPSTKLIYNVTGSVVDGTGYRKVTVAHVSGTTLPSSTAHLAVQFSRTGNNGIDGEMAGPGVSIDGEIALYNGTGGATLKRATTSGLLKAASGVLAQATAGTDYYAPGSTDVAVVDGGTGASDASGARTNLGLVIGTNVQAQDATLQSIAGLGTAADRMIYTTGVDTWAELAVTSVGRGLLDDTTTAAQLATLTARGQGKETIFIPAAAMISRTTNGAAAGTAEMTTNKNMFKTLDFDTSTQEFAQFEVWFPKSWDLGTVTFQPQWSHASTTTNFGVVWGLAGVARSDDDAGDVAFGTAQTSTDTGGTTNDIYLGPESSAITIAGTPAAGDTVQFQINRTVADGSDTLGIDARLHGIRLFFTTSAATDA